MTGVFISYRRADSGGWAGRLFDHLSMRFGKDLVFQDFDDIAPGDDFLKVIRIAIETCNVFLVVIGPLWLKDANGQRRLDNPDDVLRTEVTEALGGGLTVIPVLVGGAKIPSSTDLPDPIKPLLNKHAIEVSDSRWNYDVDVLIDRLRELIIPTRKQLSLTQAQQELHQMQLRYFEMLPDDAAGALELAQKTQALLNHVSPLYPQDPYLQVVRGYCYKNEAMGLRNLGRYEEFVTALNAADRVFKTMIRERPDDAGAYNGRGSVEGLRGNYKEALDFIDRALEIDSKYEAAQRDREEVLRRFKK